MADSNEEYQRLLALLQDLRKRMPAHSVKPELIRQLEELEERIDEMKNSMQKNG